MSIMKKSMVYIVKPEMIWGGLKPTKRYLSQHLKGKDLPSQAYYQCLEKTKTLG